MKIFIIKTQKLSQDYTLCKQKKCIGVISEIILENILILITLAFLKIFKIETNF